MVYKIIVILFFSQIFYLGVFGLSQGAIYVINETDNLCGEFTRGNSEESNWLQTGWQSVQSDQLLSTNFEIDTICQQSSVENCCKSQGYRYAGVPIGVENISPERKASEFISGKKIIETHSLEPDLYNLENNISRKEVMKVIINTSGIEFNDFCREVFADVIDDWGCKYIEAALDNDYIVGNQSFRPNDEITKTEALKLIFKAREVEKAYTTDSWQEDYVSTALYFNYIDEKYTNYNESASRGWIFSVLAKTYPEFSKY